VLALVVSVWPVWAEPAATLADVEVVSLAALFEAAASVIDEHKAALMRCQIDAERNHHEALETILRDLVRADLRDLEADRLGITAETVAAQIDEGAEPVTDADVSSFHRDYDIAEPLSEIAPEIRAYLERQATDRARAVAYADLEHRYSVAYLLEPLRYEVAADGFASARPMRR